MDVEPKSPSRGSYQQVKDIVSEALDKGPETRLAFVEEACGDDARLKEEVLSLLAGDELMGDTFIAKPVVPRRSESEELADRHEIGPYRLLRRLGAGGMGVVYLAERRVDFEQRVALKLISRGLENDEIVGRFEHERQILANLQHPNIARLLEGATTDDGLPYFVMEYVEGVPIDTYCTANEVPVAGRLALFRKVCEAVAFAHRNLVVHRDIKPANILVTENGTPKLLDFGIAKLLNSEGGNPKTGLLRPLTTEYAAPEQLAYENVTTASDIYTLGVLLYELLVGRRPYAKKESNPQTLLEATRQYQPVAPSLAVDQETGLRRRLSGDLDAIVLKMLRLEPEERYASVEQLLDDLERHRRRLPVLARRGSWTYKAGKFVRRNGARLVVGAVSLGLVGSLGLAGLESRRAEQERLQKVEEAKSAEAFGELLFNVFDEVNPDRGGPVDREYFEIGGQILDKAAARSRVDLKDQPLQRGIILGALGRVFRLRGDFHRALELLTESEELRRQELGDDNPGLVVLLSNQGSAYRSLGRFREAEGKYREALRLERLAPEASPTKISTALNNLAGVEKELGKHAAAIASYLEALAIKEQLVTEARLAEDGENTLSGRRRSLALGHSNLGSALVALGEAEAAEDHFRSALEILNSLGESPRLERSRASALKNYGVLRRLQGELESASWMLAENLEIRRRYATGLPEALAVALREMARLDQDLGEHQQALLRLDEVLQLQIKLYGENHPETGRTLIDLGVSQRALEDPQAAETWRRALDILESSLPADHPDTVRLIELMSAPDS